MGVLQGTILGPLFYISIVNDLPMSVTDNSIETIGNINTDFRLQLKIA